MTDKNSLEEFIYFLSEFDDYTENDDFFAFDQDDDNYSPEIKLANTMNKNDSVNKSDQFQRSVITNDQHEQNNSIPKHRLPKRNRHLSGKALELKNRYYSIFTFSKKFPKEYVLKIHKEYLVDQLKYPKLTRDQTREIDLYFLDYADKKDEILEFLEKNKEELSRGPLKNIKKPRNN